MVLLGLRGAAKAVAVYGDGDDVYGSGRRQMGRGERERRIGKG